MAVIPGVMAVALLLFGVRETERNEGIKRSSPVRRENLKRLGSAYWWVVAIGAVFTLARFSEAFLVLRAHEGGTPRVMALRRCLPIEPEEAAQTWFKEMKR